MKKLLLLKIIICLLGFLILLIYKTQKPTTEDQFYKKLEIAKTQPGFGDKIIAVGKSFIGTPYDENTLEQDSESLVLRYDSLDCTTFVENTIAIALTSNNKDASYNIYRTVLRRLRYRQGIIQGWGSRIHYFTEWKQNLEKRGIGGDLSEYYGGIAGHRHLNYLSQNTEGLMPKDSFMILMVEKNISVKPIYYVPVDSVPKIESKLQNGDILGFVSSDTTLDINHMGFCIIQNNKPFLLHASKPSGVQISQKFLYDYLIENKNKIGIIIYRI